MEVETGAYLDYHINQQPSAISAFPLVLFASLITFSPNLAFSIMVQIQPFGRLEYVTETHSWALELGQTLGALYAVPNDRDVQKLKIHRLEHANSKHNLRLRPLPSDSKLT
jgi:hypothetical protein